MSYLSVTQVMDELIKELGNNPGPCERVVDEFFGSVELNNGQIHNKAEEAVYELRQSWGPTADPHWVKDLIPSRKEQSNQTEYDCYFALFRRDAFWAYVRISAPENDAPKAYLRLTFGVVRGR